MTWGIYIAFCAVGSLCALSLAITLIYLKEAIVYRERDCWWLPLLNGMAFITQIVIVLTLLTLLSKP